MGDFMNPSGEQLTLAEKLVLYPLGVLATVGWAAYMGSAVARKVLRNIWRS